MYFGLGPLPGEQAPYPALCFYMDSCHYCGRELVLQLQVGPTAIFRVYPALVDLHLVRDSPDAWGANGLIEDGKAGGLE